MAWTLPNSGDWLQLNAGYIMPPHFRLWTLLTSAAYHSNFLELAAALAMVLIVGKRVEPLWGSRELGKFVVLVLVGAGLSLCVLVYVMVGVVPDQFIWRDHLLFETPLSGSATLLAAFAVVGKQLWGEQPFVLLTFHVRVKQVPLLLCAAHGVAAALGFVATRFFMSVAGAAVAWIYLRYWQVSSITGLQGDLSDSFALKSFWPWYYRNRAAVELNAETDWIDLTEPVDVERVGQQSLESVRRKKKANADLQRRLEEKRLTKTTT